MDDTMLSVVFFLLDDGSAHSQGVSVSYQSHVMAADVTCLPDGAERIKRVFGDLKRAVTDAVEDCVAWDAREFRYRCIHQRPQIKGSNYAFTIPLPCIEKKISLIALK
jgi:hypothetical protein